MSHQCSDRTARASSGDSRSNDDEHGGDDDADDPPDPVHARSRPDTKRGRDVVAYEDTPDAADHGEPQRDVVSVTRRDELTQKPDDEPRDEDAHNLHLFLLLM